MHFVVGGAFQGKRKWVKHFYGLDKKSHVWCSCYNKELALEDRNIVESIVVFEGLETFIRQKISENLLSDRQDWQNMFQKWLQWESEEIGRRVIWIGCDITQGIVPMTEVERRWRDLTGWCYQDLAEMCDRVDRIWCGLHEPMKWLNK